MVQLVNGPQRLLVIHVQAQDRLAEGLAEGQLYLLPPLAIISMRLRREGTQRHC